MEIKKAQEMAIKAQEARVEQWKQNTAAARTYAEEHLMPQIEAAAEKGENSVKFYLNSIENEAVKDSISYLMIEYDYKVDYSGDVLILKW